MLKKAVRHHNAVASHSRAEIRDPLLKVVLAIVLTTLGGYIEYRVVDVVWLNPPEAIEGFDGKGLMLLFPLWGGALYLFYIAYLLLFASVRRARKGFLRPIVLRLSAVLIIALGINVIVKGNIHGLFVVFVGVACLGLARDRKDFIASDKEWL